MCGSASWNLVIKSKENSQCYDSNLSNCKKTHTSRSAPHLCRCHCPPPVVLSTSHLKLVPIGGDFVICKHWYPIQLLASLSVLFSYLHVGSHSRVTLNLLVPSKTRHNSQPSQLFNIRWDYPGLMPFVLIHSSTANHGPLIPQFFTSVGLTEHSTHQALC